MRWMLGLIALCGLAAFPAMAAPPVEKGAKGSATEQKQSQEKPIVSKPPLGSMVLIPAGEFTMGSQDGDADERPAHKVIIDSFSIDVYEVTVGEYGDFYGLGRPSPSGLEQDEPNGLPQASGHGSRLGGRGRLL